MNGRVRVIGFCFISAFLLILVRLAYWQLVRGNELAKRADSQYFDTLELPALRGDIKANDDTVLAGSIPTFLLYAYKPNLKAERKQLADRLSLVLPPTTEMAATGASDPKQHQQAVKALKEELEDRLTRPTVWEQLGKLVPLSQKRTIESWNIPGLGFQSSSSRFYPEASSSAHVLGFLGSDASGNPKGYFGLEGYYDRELRGVPGSLQQEKDAFGNPILVGSFQEIPPVPGRTVVTSIDRYVERIVERSLSEGVERYGASAGEVVVMDPETGAVIASASLPTYDPGIFWRTDPSLLRDPTISEGYEPGSTFKVLVMAAALDSGVIDPDTTCDSCDGPVEIGKYTIRTWDEKYRPGETMTDVIVHSDNTGMIFVANRLGQERFVEYLKKFGIGVQTGIDVQGEVSPLLRKKWGDIDLATASFGQGIAVTTMQMIRAVAAIANGGELVTPHVASKIMGERGEEWIKPRSLGRVVSKKASEEVTAMMVKSVQEGEAKFAAPKGYVIAGKTGTAQIPVAGHYDEEKTIASFVGFAPASKPKFVMIIKLREPKSSPWGSETAAPLWFNIAKKLLAYWEIPPTE